MSSPQSDLDMMKSHPAYSIDKSGNIQPVHPLCTLLHLGPSTWISLPPGITIERSPTYFYVRSYQSSIRVDAGTAYYDLLVATFPELLTEV